MSTLFDENADIRKSQPKTTWGDWAEWSRNGLEPKIKAHRFDDAKGNRFYWWEDSGEVVTASGITTWLGKVTPESKFLTDWKVKYGKDYPEVLNLTAEYGTAMHAMFAHILIHGCYPEKHMIESAREPLLRLKRWEQISFDQPEKDIIAFIEWTKEYKVKPLMIEAVLPCHTPRGEWYCMTADLPCELTITEKVEVQDGVLQSGKNKGEPKMVKVARERTVTAVVDFKSNPFGKESKSFFESHLHQLIGTKKALEQNFGIKVDEMYNWSPDNWRTNPSSTFHRWNPSEADYKKFDLLEGLAEATGAMRPEGKIRVYSDKWNAEDVNHEMFKSYDYKEYVREFLMGAKP